MSTSDDPSIQDPKENVENASNVPSDAAHNQSTVGADEGGKPVDGGVSTVTGDKSVPSEQKKLDADDDGDGADEDEDEEEDDDDDDDDAKPEVTGDDAVVYPRRPMFAPKGRPTKGTSSGSGKR